MFHYSCAIKPEWIDYNGHLQDAYYGLVFSYAVDGVQDALGLDAAYRAASGCTVFVVEDHKFFLREVKEGAMVTVESVVIGHDTKRFHLHMTMQSEASVVAVCEAMELHVQTRPHPHATDMPAHVQHRLAHFCLDPQSVSRLRHRARAMAL